MGGIVRSWRRYNILDLRFKLSAFYCYPGGYKTKEVWKIQTFLRTPKTILINNYWLE